jgi:hypothetical protein
MKKIFRQNLAAASILMSFFMCQTALAAPTSFTGVEDYGWYTRDTLQALDFLDVNIFVNQDWYYFKDGVEYNGRIWRLASAYEVSAIWKLAQVNVPLGVGQYSPGTISDPFISELIGLFGRTDGNASAAYKFTNGWTSSLVPESTNVYAALLWDYDVNIGGFDLYRTNGAADPQQKYTSHGAWLVAANPVPLPGAVWLLGSGLIGLVAFKRKFKR